MKKIVILFLLTHSIAISNTAKKVMIEKDGILYYPNVHTPFTGKYIKKHDILVYKNGYPHGLWRTFYSNGRLKSIENWYEGKLHGVYILYRDNGNKILEVTYFMGKEEGDYKVYYPNGNIRIIGQLEDGEAVGVWRFYDENKKLILEQAFEKSRKNNIN